MNSKFFGNSLDLFKYDILSHILKRSKELSLLYVPMITKPLTKERNSKYTTYELGQHNNTLCDLMIDEFAKEYSEINIIKSYFINSGIEITMFRPDGPNSNIIYFDEYNRKEYFDNAIKHYKKLLGSTFVYIDPDVGSDVGITRRFRSNKNMYVKKFELLKFKHGLRRGDFIAFFQHLGNSNYTIDQRLSDLNDCFGDWVLFIGYARIQAGIVFIFNEESTYRDKRKLVEEYFKEYHYLRHRDKFIIKGKPPKSGGFLAL